MNSLSNRHASFELFLWGVLDKGVTSYLESFLLFIGRRLSKGKLARSWCTLSLKLIPLSHSPPAHTRLLVSLEGTETKVLGTGCAGEVMCFLVNGD